MKKVKKSASAIVLAQQTGQSRSVVDSWQRLLYGLFLISLLTPLIYRTDVFFGYTSVRALFFGGIVTLMGLVSLLIAQPRRISLLGYGVLLWLCVLILTSLMGVDPEISIWSGFSRMEGAWLYLYLGLYYGTLYQARFSRRQWEAAFLVSLAVAVLVVLIGLIQKTGFQADDKRFIAMVGNASFLAAYLLGQLFLLVFVIVWQSHWPRWWRLAGGLLVGLILSTGLLLTGSRSALLATTVGGAIALVFIGKALIRQNLRVVAGLLIGIMLLGSSVSYLATTSTMRQLAPVVRFTHLYGQLLTWTSRQENWQIAIDAIKARPILGWGMGNYNYGLALHYRPSFVLQGVYWYDRIHNVPMEWAFGGGLLLLTTYMAVWLLLGRTLLVSKVFSKPQKYTLLAGWVAAFVFNLLNPDSLLALMIFFIWLAFVDSEKANPDNSRRLPVGVRLGLGVWLLAMAYPTLYIPVRTLKQLNQQRATPDLEQRFTLLETSFRQATIGKMEVADQAVTVALDVMQARDLPSEAKAFCYQKALTLWEEVCRQRPLSTRSFIRQASLRLAHDDYAGAFRLYEQAMALEQGHRPSLYLQVGDAYLQQRNFVKAQQAFTKARQLEPRWEAPLVHQALAFALQNAPLRCDSTLRRVSDKGIVDNLSEVEQAYQLGRDRAGFVRRIEAVTYKHQFQPTVYVVWATAAFELHDERALRTAINSFARHYGALFSDFPHEQIVADALQRNQSPAEILQHYISQL